MLLLSGDVDSIATASIHQQPVYEGTNVEVLWARLLGPGGDHVGIALNGLTTYRNVMLAWWRLQLVDDQDFHDRFFSPNRELCSDSMWTVLPTGGL